jgi:hypothetical protein
MKVYAVTTIPVGKSLLPKDCLFSDNDAVRTVYVPTDISVDNQKQLAKLMRDDPARFAGYSWVAFPDTKPVKVIKTEQYRIGI